MAISITVQPSDQISAGGRYPSCPPVTTSGAMNWMVPETNNMVRMRCVCVCVALGDKRKFIHDFCSKYHDYQIKSRCQYVMASF